MKKNLWTGAVVALGFALGTASCGDDPSLKEAGTGRISPRITVDCDLITASGASRADRANEDVVVTVSDLKLRLTSDDGSFSQEWESINDFDENQEFKVGDYTLEAYYGDENDIEGYGKPHFHGSQDISVHYDRTTEVSMQAAMKNCRVVIKYTDAFKDYMTAYSVQLRTPKGKYVSVPGDEYSPVYVAPGSVSVNLSYTRPNGEGATIEAAKFEAKAKTEHVVTIDLNGGQGSEDAILKVSFDSTVDQEDVEIDLDDLVNAPAPEITPEGWESGQYFLVIENTLPATPVKANIMACGKIASVTLTTDSPSLKNAGWPSVVDLDPATPEATIAKLSELGLKMFGICKNPDMMGVIDFTEVFANLGVSAGLTESNHKFTLQVKDSYGNLSNIVEFTVISNKGSIKIHSATAQIGRKTITAEVEYNGEHNLDDVTFQLRNLHGIWDNLTLTDVRAVDGKTGFYDVTLTSAEAIQSSQTLKATYGSVSHSYDIEINTPEFELIASPNNTFARYAILTVHCDDADDAIVAQSLTFTRNGIPYDRYEVNGADIKFKFLTPATNYTFEASSANHSAIAQVTTEAAEHLPGCDHPDDDPNAEHSVGFGTWNAEKKSDYQWLWSTPGWSTLNELTTSTYGTGSTTDYAYQATSGTIPANGRSTQSSTSDGALGTGRHADGHTAGNPLLYKNRQNSGSNAALIRTVGWGKGNTAHIGTSSNQGFGTCQNKTPGELYLGSYNNGPIYGIDFTSRPSELKFYYHYDPAKAGNGDYGTAEIHVYDEDGVEISHSEVLHLSERASDRWIDTSKKMPYTLATIPITYERGANKAARISIIFRSTRPDQNENPALNSNNTTYWNTPGGNNRSGGEYVGSELYIDDVQLIY